MKLRFYFILSVLFTSFSLLAQDNPTKKDPEGEVKVYQDEAIKNLIGAPRNTGGQNQTDGGSTSTTTSKDSSVTKATGTVSENKRGSYRVLVFAGNDQKKSKQEAFSKRNMVKNRFPEMSVDVQYDSPVWKVRAGFYSNRADAEAALYALKNAFPSFGGEMYVVRVASKK